MLINKKDDFLVILRKLEKTNSPVIFDLETTGLFPFSGDMLCGVGMKIDGQGFYMPFRHVISQLNLFCDHKQLKTSLIVLLSDFFSDSKKTIVGHNIKFDILFMEKEGIVIKNKIIDTMYMAHLIDENASSFQLEKLAGDSSEKMRIKNIIRKRRLKSYAEISPEEMHDYALKDLDLTDLLFKKFNKESKDFSEFNDLLKFDMSFCSVLKEIEKIGFFINKKELKEQLIKTKKAEKQIYEKLVDLAGKDFNPASTIQVLDILSKKFGINTKTTNKVFLEQQRNPFCKSLMKYRAIRNRRTDFLEVYERFLTKDSTVHTSFGTNLSSFTKTGRLRSSNPNMQNLPVFNVGKEGEINIKKLIQSRPNFLFLCCDYSQAELRIAAHFAGEEAMIEQFINKEDIHMLTAERVLGKRDKESRQMAKRINFAMIYGVGAKGLAEYLELPFEEAYEVLQSFHRSFPSFRRLQKRAEEVQRRRGYIRYFTGRRRRNVEDPHKAMNSLIQGTVAEIMKIKMIELYNKLNKHDTRIMHQIHDSLIFEIRKEEMFLIPSIVQCLETSPFPCKVPMVVESHIGPDLSNLKEV